MRHQLGFALQFLVLALLPLLIWWQSTFNFPPIWMPALLTVGVVLFWFGTRLRES